MKNQELRKVCAVLAANTANTEVTLLKTVSAEYAYRVSINFAKTKYKEKDVREKAMASAANSQHRMNVMRESLEAADARSVQLKIQCVGTGVKIK